MFLLRKIKDFLKSCFEKYIERLLHIIKIVFSMPMLILSVLVTSGTAMQMQLDNKLTPTELNNNIANH